MVSPVVSTVSSFTFFKSLYHVWFHIQASHFRFYLCISISYTSLQTTSVPRCLLNLTEIFGKASFDPGNSSNKLASYSSVMALNSLLVMIVIEGDWKEEEKLQSVFIWKKMSLWKVRGKCQNLIVFFTNVFIPQNYRHQKFHTPAQSFHPVSELDHSRSQDM